MYWLVAVVVISFLATVGSGHRSVETLTAKEQSQIQ
jgi:hypothetical protein